MSTSFEYINLGTDAPNVIALKATGKVTGDDMHGLIERVDAILATGAKARVYIDMVGFDGAELGAATEKIKRMGTLWKGFERVAYVVDKGWLSKWIGMFDAITPMHLRAFDPDQDADARAWILSTDDVGA